MKDLDYWNLFYETGRIDDYLHYACTSEESQLKQQEQREAEHAGASDRIGTVSIADWGIR